MVTDKDVAKYINEVSLKINSDLNHSIIEIQNRLPEDELKVYKFAVGKVMMSVFDNMIDPLYTQHSELKPENLD